ncbi:cache domain-containing protein [Arthrobacter sp. NPDC089319]|uniref:cache domain-containing protein n=1 Tax=Arthrobacter sp. NPDC089319 TaxID=3155915 RepID=UPI00343D7B10
MTAPATSQAADSAAAIEAWLNGLYQDLHASSKDVANQLEERISSGSNISPADIVGIAEMAASFLDSHDIAVGAGEIFSLSAIKDAEGVLEWWIRNDSGGIEKFGFDLAPEGDRFYDYEKLPWFSIAAKTGRQSISGPYVDYLGFDEYIVTCAVPTYVHGRFIGVTGCDIRIRDLENKLIPIVRRIPGDAALLNDQNRVILGNSGRFIVGERIKSEPDGFAFLPLDVPNLNLRLICPTN